jgi:hypothetical protein
MGEKAFSAARVHNEKARDAASVTNEWLTKLKNQTKSERGKNKNAKAADKVTEAFFLFSYFHIQVGCDIQGMTIF